MKLSKPSSATTVLIAVYAAGIALMLLAASVKSIELTIAGAYVVLGAIIAGLVYSFKRSRKQKSAKIQT